MSNIAGKTKGRQANELKFLVPKGVSKDTLQLWPDDLGVNKLKLSLQVHFEAAADSLM